jgi:hypothetical protein
LPFRRQNAVFGIRLMKLKLFLVTLLLSPSLAGAAPRVSEMLIGKWHYEDKNYSSTLTFHADGTFAGEAKEHSKALGQVTGRWSISGSIIHYEDRKSSLDGVPVGTLDEDKLLEIGPDWFVIVTSDGKQRKYHRVSDTSSSRARHSEQSRDHDTPKR